MRFFVPDVRHGGKLRSWRAERAWRYQRLHSGEAHATVVLERRIYSLRFRRDDLEMTATVGEADPFGADHVVTMILGSLEAYLVVMRNPRNRWGGQIATIRRTDVFGVVDFDG